ncbi:MAG: antibiotic biosynthesis monooxygenase [Proteobacteria bacterium]|nr:antibiotic biosynthesis monooxygenase [Pseudomonadota bacterium]
MSGRDEVVVIAEIRARAETVAALATVLRRLAMETRHEPGCRAYEVYRSRDDAAFFQTVERWADLAAVDAHLRSAHVGAALAAAGPLLRAAPVVRIVEPLEFTCTM